MADRESHEAGRVKMGRLLRYIIIYLVLAILFFIALAEIGSLQRGLGRDFYSVVAWIWGPGSLSKFLGMLNSGQDDSAVYLMVYQYSLIGALILGAVFTLLFFVMEFVEKKLSRKG